MAGGIGELTGKQLLFPSGSLSADHPPGPRVVSGHIAAVELRLRSRSALRRKGDPHVMNWREEANKRLGEGQWVSAKRKVKASSR